MTQPEKPRADDDQPTLAGGMAALRAPGESSPSAARPSADSRPPSDAPTMIDLGGSKTYSPAPPRLIAAARNTTYSASDAGPILQPGSLLGHRYEILALLGEGGMGAVYKAKDLEVNQLVALKVIRPDLASSPAIIERFKQELILARQVTHKNVIRIFDIAEADGVKFITMEFVEGADLRTLINEKNKVSPEESVEIMRQVSHALEAAHSVGIIHRDLKPQNIMRDTTGRVLVMDFGLARTFEGTGMTQSGAMVGTMEYMSPEQALGKNLDQRSDLFALGLIFYELLSGKVPFSADSALASLIKRTQERAAPVSDTDSSIPGALAAIVSKCLERDPNLRYQSAAELLADLERWQGGRAAATLNFPTSSRPWGQTIPWHVVGAVAALVVVIAVAAWYVSKRQNVTVVAHAPVSVLVADFQNNTSDTLFDDTLEPMFNVALEGASFINAYSRGQARKLAHQLPKPTDKLDEQSGRLVAVSQGLGAVITGSLSRRGDGYKLSVEALDARTGNSIAAAEVNASNKDELLLSIPKLVAPIRKALGDTTSESVQLAATQGSFAASNLEAVHQYGVAMEQQSAGKMQDALQSFSKAAELDPNFARAYAGMAATSRSLGNEENAEKYIKVALEHVDRMSERERYRIRGLYYLYSGDFAKCIEEYTALVKLYPADNLGHNNLAGCYNELHNYPKALEEMQSALQTTPNSSMYRLNISVLSTYTGDFQTAEQQARTVLQSNPSFEQAYEFLAYAQLGQEQLAQASETYQKVGKLSPLGASMSASGLADLALYEGRFSDAVRILESGAAADLAAKNSRENEKFAVLAYTQLLWGHKGPALEAAKRALLNTQKVNIRFLVARVFVEAGEAQKASAMAASLGSELSQEAQADAKLIEGEVALQDKDARKAIQLFTEANKLLETWVGRYDLGRAYLEAGLNVEADSEFDLCLKWRGEAMELLDGPTYGYFPPVYYYQGRVREGLKSSGAADSYRTYLSIRGNSREDPLVPEVRRRLGQ